MSILFQNISYIDQQFKVIENGFVAVRDGRIAYLGSTRPQGEYDRIYPGKNKLLMPGFYNNHTHLAMSLLRGYGENMTLQDWLFNHIFPFEDCLTSKAVYWANLLGIAEAIAFGTVSATDMYMDVESVCAGAAETGFKMNVSLMKSMELKANPSNEFPFYGAKQILKQHHGACDQRILVDAAIHSEYTTSQEFVREMATFAQENQLHMHLHLSETKLEHEECKARQGGKTPAAYFNELGVFQVPTTAAHCVWAEPEDLKIFQAKGVTVSSCPVSNLKLASGICPAPAMLDLGINLALGTDSVASNNNLDMLEEIKLFAILHKANQTDPKLITIPQALRAATLAGAKAQGRPDCGAIKLGNRADLIVFDLDKPYCYPQHHLANNLVYSAKGSDVIFTMVDGKILYENGEYLTLDIEKTIFEVQKHTKDILQQLKS